MDKDDIIKSLNEKLEAEIFVKKNEVLINAAYKQVITKLEDQIQTLVEINEKLYNDVAELKERLKKVSSTIYEK
jgi:chaperonin cofactor prefoldin